MNYEKEYKNFSEWWEQLTVNNPEWKTLERLAAKDAWMEATKRAEANDAERSSDKCHIQNVNARFSKEQSHEVRKLCRDFYLWMQANDYDHNIPMMVENKAELFLREKNVR